MDWKIVVAALLVTTASTPGILHETPNEPPAVDAGLDQRVTTGSTVLLDGGGTRDPDGTIIELHWQIETPDGDTITPTCPSCTRTRFQATNVGEYAVSLTATDDDGATRTDTLYVIVTADAGPSVELAGPLQATTNDDVSFSATPTAGSEPISDVTWQIDGETAPDENGEALTRDFDDTGTHSVSVTVTDAIGRTATATHSIDVSSAPGGPAPEPGTGDPPNASDPDDPDRIVITPVPSPGIGSPPNDSSGNSSTGSIAERYAPTIDGPRVVTGDEPLEATYTLSNAPAPANVTRVRWRINEGTTMRGSAIRVTWIPGDHTLEAHVKYTDGSTDVARFPDGTNAVTADPAPELQLGSVSITEGTLTGSFVAVDDYENIQSVDVIVDDATVFEGNYPPIDRYTPGRVRNDFRFDEIRPNTNVTITLTATDARGQTRNTHRTIQSREGPEIISIGFQDETVDSYHPRISSDRYTATHVVKIDPNGYPVDEISAETWTVESDVVDLKRSWRNYVETENVIVVKSNWAGEIPGEYNITTFVKLSGNIASHSESQFRVTPSPPELRLTSVNQGTKKLVQNWGMVVDASGSFDPDDHHLEISWTGGATPIENKPWVAKLDPKNIAGVRIEDRTGASASEPGSFLPYYVPRIEYLNRDSSEPYHPDDTVEYTIKTAAYAFSKNEKRYNISLGIRSNSSAVDVLSLEKKRLSQRQVQGRNAVQNRTFRWIARLEVKASALNNGNHWITIYNKENPNRIYVSKELGDVGLEFEREKRNLTVVRTAYRVINDSNREKVRVRDRDRYRQLTKGGWELESTHEVVDSVVIESRTVETITKTRRKEFDSRTFARQYSKIHTGWSYVGQESYEQTEERIVTRWRKQRTAGLPTGETRRVVSNPNAYVKQRQYRYTTTRQVTVEKEITKRIPKQVTVEKTIEEEVCTRFLGCIIETRNVSYETTKMVEQRVTVERIETRRSVQHYWSRRSRLESHTATGRTRQKRTEPERYHTEYLVNVPVEVTETEYRYVTEKLVKSERSEWTYSTETERLMKARSIATAPNKRIGSIETHPEWTFLKEVPGPEVVQSFENKQEVQRTYAVVSAVLVYGPDASDTRTVTINVEIDGHATKEEVLEKAMNETIACNPNFEDCNE